MGDDKEAPRSTKLSVLRRAMTSPAMTTPSLATSFNKIPFKLLELRVIAAHDLPPVSRYLHTYVMAWVHPDNKMITPVDHKGNTNPKWNFRMVFGVDDKFLNSESSAIMLEIYNISKLSNRPIGTTCLPVDILLNNPHSEIMKKPLKLPIARPSGDLRGYLIVTINLVNTTIRNLNEEAEPSPRTIMIRQISQRLTQAESAKRVTYDEDEEEGQESDDVTTLSDHDCESIDIEIKSLASDVSATLIGGGVHSPNSKGDSPNFKNGGIYSPNSKGESPNSKNGGIYSPNSRGGVMYSPNSKGDSPNSPNSKGDLPNSKNGGIHSSDSKDDGIHSPHSKGDSPNSPNSKNGGIYSSDSKDGGIHSPNSKGDSPNSPNSKGDSPNSKDGGIHSPDFKDGGIHLPNSKGDSPNSPNSKGDSPNSKDGGIHSPDSKNGGIHSLDPGIHSPNSKGDSPNSTNFKDELSNSKDGDIHSADSKDSAIHSPDSKGSGIHSPDSKDNDIHSPDSKDDGTHSPDSKDVGRHLYSPDSRDGGTHSPDSKDGATHSPDSKDVRQIYSPDFKDGIIYSPNFKEGAMYSPDFKDGAPSFNEGDIYTPSSYRENASSRTSELDNRSEAGEQNNDEKENNIVPSRKDKNLIEGDEPKGSKGSKHPKLRSRHRRHSDGGGLLSFFTTAIMCGSGTMSNKHMNRKLKKKSRSTKRSQSNTMEVPLDHKKLPHDI